MSNRNKLISLAPRKPRPASASVPLPTLKEFWEALQQAKNGDAPSSARTGSGAASSGHRYGSGSWFGSRSGSGSGSGDGGAGYGIGLVAPADRFSRERILTIMRDLCAKEAGQKNKP